MVERIESSGGLEEFDAIVEKIELEEGIEGRKQYHLILNPTSFVVKGSSKKMHEWLPLSRTASENAIPQGSVLDKFLMQVEIMFSEAKKKSTVFEELSILVGKKFKFKKLKLGRDFNDKKAREYLVPVAYLQ